MKKVSPPPTVLALGHSTRPIEKFLLMLHAHSVATLVDIRTVPKSRRNPQFDGDSIKASLSEEGIRYIQMKELGGLRRPTQGSLVNAGWVNDNFRGFADYMQTEEFDAALAKLIALAGETKAEGDGLVAIMCAEGNHFRCHRSLVADALEARGVRVIQISRPGAGRPHKMTPFAKTVGNRVTYPEYAGMPGDS